MRNRNKQIRKALSITDYRVPKDTLKDKEKIKKERGKKHKHRDISLEISQKPKERKTRS